MKDIRAGRIDEAVRSSGEWMFVDVGFSKREKSCGVLFEDGEPRELTFSDAKTELVELATASSLPLNIVLEAPLSVAFTSTGDPIGRAIEIRGSETRYWYACPGCIVLVAATYLVRAISDAQRTREIRLFEGLVSFKPPLCQGSCRLIAHRETRGEKA